MMCDQENCSVLEAFEAHHRLKQIQIRYQCKIAQSKLLQQKPTQEQLDSLIFLHRSSIQTGKLIGQGSFCQVYQVTGFDLDAASVGVRNQQTFQDLQERAQNGQLVLKQVNPDIQDFHAAAADLAAEAAFLMRLRHEHLLPLRGLPPNFVQAFAESKDSFFLLLDRIDTTLYDELKAWRHKKRAVPSVADRLDQARQLAQVLEYLHEQGVVYRDLKPDNVGLCRATNQIQLFDLGLSRQLPKGSANSSLSSKTYQMSCVGTPRYMAPEVNIHEKYNTKADVYGWAILTWELLAASRAFPDYNTKQLFHRVYIGEERPPLKAVPLTGMHTILAQAWHENSRDRPTMKDLLPKLSHEEKAPPRMFGIFRRRSSSSRIPNSLNSPCA